MKREHKETLSNISQLNDFDKAELDAVYVDILPDSPKPRSKVLTAYKIAYELQRRAEGGLKAGNRTKLKRLASGKVKQSKNSHDLQAGTRLTRVWNGSTYNVMVLGPKRFEYNGNIYKSLSKIAKEITGAHWSGPLFFGLKKQSTRMEVKA
jgi:hypothetical protein